MPAFPRDLFCRPAVPPAVAEGPTLPLRCTRTHCEGDDRSMSIADSLLPEFDQEMASTRRALERVDEDQLAWKPHERSTTLGGLASHLAQLAGMAARVFAGDSVDVAPPGGPPPVPTQLASRQAILDAFDANVTKSREALAQADDAAMGETWTLLRGGQTMFSLPRAA